MELRVLTYFLMVAREENITKAAQLLHVTQPTLSRQLMQLEDELGVKLFVRGSHKITLTEDGMLLKRRALDIVGLAEKTVREFQSEKEEISGEITIGCGELLCIDYFTKICNAFQTEHPLVRYNIRTGAADDTKERIELGLIDIGVIIAPGDISKYESVLLPQKEENYALVKSDSPLVKKGFVTPEDLLDEDLIISNRFLYSNILSNWFKTDYGKLKIKTTYNLMYNAASMVKNGNGIAIGVKLNWNLDGIAFLPLEPRITYDPYFIWKKNETLSVATSTFIEFAKAYIENGK